ncbi:hypothetical protein NKJ86_10525 [Mesorhizobium sp. M0025]
MKFVWGYSGGNCNDCEFMVAEGTIEDDSVDDFRKLGGPGLVYLNSEGGSLMGALALGNEFRKQGIRTIVGAAVPRSDNPDVQDVSGEGVCLSACTYAFLGGVERTVPAGAKYGIHSFTSEAKPGSDASFSAADITNAQILTGILLEYTQRMGADPILVKMASGQAADSMSYLSETELEQLRVNWDPVLAPSPHLEIYKNGLVAVTQTADKSATVTLFCKDRNLNLMLSQETADRKPSDQGLPEAGNGSDDGQMLLSTDSKMVGGDFTLRKDERFAYRTLKMDREIEETMTNSPRFQVRFGVVRPEIEAVRADIPSDGLMPLFAMLRRNCL